MAPITTLDVAAAVEDNLGLIAPFLGPADRRGTHDRHPNVTSGTGLLRPAVGGQRGARRVEERRTHDLVLLAEAFCRLVYGRPATLRARARIP